MPQPADEPPRADPAGTPGGRRGPGGALPPAWTGGLGRDALVIALQARHARRAAGRP